MTWLFCVFAINWERSLIFFAGEQYTVLYLSGFRTVLQIRDIYPGSEFFSSWIRTRTFYPSRILDPGGQKGTGSRIPDPQHWFRMRVDHCRVAAWLSPVVGAQVEGKEAELAVCRSRLQELTRELRSSGAENSLLRSGVALVD
jgi:hypothetical protein